MIVFPQEINYINILQAFINDNFEKVLIHLKKYPVKITIFNPIQ